VQVGNIAPVAIGAAVSHKNALPDVLALAIPAFYAMASVSFVATGRSLRFTGESKEA